MAEYKVDREAKATTELAFSQMVMAYRLGRIDRKTAARISGYDEKSLDQVVDKYIDSLQEAPWDTYKPFVCNVCGERYDGADVFGFSVPEDEEHSLGFLPPSGAPRHVCHRCIKSFLCLARAAINASKEGEGQ